MLLDRFFGIKRQEAVFFLMLKNVYVSPNEAFLQRSFRFETVDLLDCSCFYFAVGIKNMDEAATDDRDRIFWVVAGISDGKVTVFHGR